MLVSIIGFLGTLLYPSASGASPSTNRGGHDQQDCAIEFFDICLLGNLPINITWPWATPSPTPKPASTQNSGHSWQSTPTPKPAATAAPTVPTTAPAAATPQPTAVPVRSNRQLRSNPTPTPAPVVTPTPASTPKTVVTPKPIDPVQITADQPSQPAVQSIAAADTNLNRGTPPRVDSAQPSHSATAESASAAGPSSAASSTELAIYAGSNTAPVPVGYSAILAAVIAGFAAGVAVVVFFAGRRRGERQI